MEIIIVYIQRGVKHGNGRKAERIQNTLKSKTNMIKCID